MEKHLHIVCLDTPYPVDHGGIFDLFYKITALHECGIKIHLHCFEYGRGEQPELNRFCVSVKYYPRQQGHKGLSLKLPYIVASRSNEDLYRNLLQDQYPILLEGVHCSLLLNDSRFSGRKIFLRLHNVEHLYYQELAKSTSSIFKKIYYRHESSLLKKYEKLIANKAIIIPVAEPDADYYRTELGASDIMPLPVFLPFKEVQSPEGLGCYCLYHGNLSVPENDKAARWLLENVFNDIKTPLVIAGKNPSKKLMHLAEKKTNTCVVANPSWEEMQDMIRKAQINIIPSFNKTGVKLKLLNVLFNGRHCITNEAAIRGTGLEAACHTGNGAAAFQSLIVQLYNQPFAEEEVRLRKALLETKYNNAGNARRLITWIW